MTFFYDLNKKLADLAAKPQPQTLNEGREQVYREYKGDVQEKWDTETKVSPEEKGKYKGKSKAELQKQYNALKARGPHKKGSPDFGKMRELAFAIRAKSGWGKVSETGDVGQGINTDKSSGTGFKTSGSQGVKPTGDLKHGMPMRLNTGSGRLPTASLPEGDMEEGNEFSGALDAARDAGKTEFQVRGKTYQVREAAAKKEKTPWPGSAEYKEKFGQDRETFRKKHAPSVMKDPKGRAEVEKLDTEYSERQKSGYGRGEEGDDEDEGKKKAPPTGEKRGRGRPKGSKRAIGAKGPSGRSKLLTREDYDEELDEDWRKNLAALGVAGAVAAGGVGGAQAKDVSAQDVGGNKAQSMQVVNDFQRNLAQMEIRADALARINPAFKAKYERAKDYKSKALAATVLPSGNLKDRAPEAERNARYQESLKLYAQELQHILGAQGAVKEQGVSEDYDRDEYDEEGEMAQSQSRTIADAAAELESMLDADENLPEWVQKKISLAQEYIDSARDYLKSNRPEQDMDESALQAYLGKKKYGAAGMKALQQAGREGAGRAKMDQIRARHDKLDEVDLDEKAVSKAQRAAAGIARAAQKGEIPRSKLRGASKEMAQMEPKELRKFAKTKEKGLPQKVGEGDIDPNRHPQTRDYGRGTDEPQAKKPAARKPAEPAKKSDKEEKVDETTTAGSVATAPAEGGKKSKGGIQYGKGIYDSMNREVEAMIAESMNVSINMNTDAHGGPSKSVTVTATDEDAEKLSELLRMAGLGQGGASMSGPSSCPSCGKAPCGCSEQVDENQPDWPTETETNDDALQYSGGLNKPKATGQTTVPVIASQADRQHALEGDDELRRLRERAGIFAEAKKKPDFPDLDKDGDKSEPMSKAIKDKESKVDEAIEGSLWNLYKRLQ